MIRSALLAGWLTVLLIGFSRAAAAGGDDFQPEGPELAILCSGDAWVSAGGVLVWDVAKDRGSHDLALERMLSASGDV